MGRLVGKQEGFRADPVSRKELAHVPLQRGERGERGCVLWWGETTASALQRINTGRVGVGEELDEEVDEEDRD